MAKKFPNQADVSFKLAAERANQYPSQIADVGAVVDSVTKEMQTPDFSVRAELYALLAKASTENEQREVLGHYRRGLEAADRVGRIELQNVWSYFFNGEMVRDVLFDHEHDQLIVSTGQRDGVKSSAMYAIGIKNGRKNWSVPMKKTEDPFTVHLGENAVYFTTDYCGENENHHHIPILHALSLHEGSNLMSWLPKNKDDGGLQIVKGVFNGLILGQSEWGKLLAIDPETKQEKWQVAGSCELISGDTILVKKANELLWVDKDGKIKNKIKFKSPKKGKKAHISCVAEDGDILYVAVLACWSTFGKNNDLTSHHWPVLYGVGKEDAKVKWSYEPSYDRNQNRVIVHPDWLYFCGDNHGTVLRKNGESIIGLENKVVHVSDKFVFYMDTDRPWRNEDFTFYAEEVNKTLRPIWQRKNFELITARNGLLFGRVKEYQLVVLDEATGKELAAVNCGQPGRITFIDNKTFCIINSAAKFVSVFRMNYNDEYKMDDKYKLEEK